jgi:hypothetical protein
MSVTQDPGNHILDASAVEYVCDSATNVHQTYSNNSQPSLRSLVSRIFLRTGFTVIEVTVRNREM